MKVFFNKAVCLTNTISYLQEVANGEHWMGDGPFAHWCHQFLEKKLGIRKALLTPSGTSALELCALLLNLEPGDEVVMPSFTFPSTANAFVLRGAVPVFVDIREDTLNIDEKLIEQAVSKQTKAIVPVHYAGVACEMHTINALCKEKNIAVIEDAAHALGSKYDRQALGTFGLMSIFSFHETKNFSCGEGGAFVTNDIGLAARAEIIREKGTNRSQFHRGEVDKYSWVDIGSSLLPSEFQAAVLKAQFESQELIKTTRHKIWSFYHTLLKDLEDKGILRRPIIPKNCQHNAHLYYIILRSLEERTQLIDFLKSRNISALFHYVPLHKSIAGRKYGRYCGSLEKTENLSECLLRLPLWVGLTDQQMEYVVQSIFDFFRCGQKQSCPIDFATSGKYITRL